MSIIFWIAVGYCLAVLFPIPWISPYIIGAWTKVIGAVKSLPTNKN